MHHSDRGVQYAAAYRAVLYGRGITLSMSRKGNCYDNAPMEAAMARSKRNGFIRNDMRNGQKPKRT